MSIDILCNRCKKIHSYRMSFCPDNAREPTLDEIEEHMRHMAWWDNQEIDRLTNKIAEIKGTNVS